MTERPATECYFQCSQISSLTPYHEVCDASPVRPTITFLASEHHHPLASTIYWMLLTCYFTYLFYAVSSADGTRSRPSVAGNETAAESSRFDVCRVVWRPDDVIERNVGGVFRDGRKSKPTDETKARSPGFIANPNTSRTRFVSYSCGLDEYDINADLKTCFVLQWRIQDRSPRAHEPSRLVNRVIWTF